MRSVKCKIFRGVNLPEMEKEINAWLAKNPVEPEKMHVTFSTSVKEIENEGMVGVSHSLVLFYIPLPTI